MATRPFSRVGISLCGCFVANAIALGCSSAATEDGGDGDGVGAASGDGDESTGGDGDSIFPGSGGAFGSSGGGSNALTGGTWNGAGGTAPTSPSTVVVVAHQDDDLLFINPVLKHAIDRGEKLTTVYLTSGNAGMGMDYVIEREMGIRSAYAFMTGETNAWSCANAPYAGKSIPTCTFSGSRDVQLVFYRLVDGWADGSATGSLESLWSGQSVASSALDGSGLSLSRDDIVNSLLDIFILRGATEILTTDFSYRDPEDDHSDHEYAAFFTLAASGKYPWPHGLRGHVTYGTQHEPMNLSASDVAIVQDTFSRYASCDKELPGCSGGPTCDMTTCSTSSELYQSWYFRHYDYERLTPPLTGVMQSGIGSCLGENGTSSAIVSCGAAIALDYEPDFTIRRADGACLTAGALATTKDLTFSACSGSLHQKWFVLETGQIVLGSAPQSGDQGAFSRAQCLGAGAGVGLSARAEDCRGGADLLWTF